jgi:hypothetical protein
LELAAHLRLELVPDFSYGIQEILRGLIQLFPHRRSVAVLGVQPSGSEELMTGLVKEGVQLQRIPFLWKTFSAQSLQSSLETLKPDTLFVFTELFEPLTGLYYPWEEVRKFCAQKKIFLVSGVRRTFLENQGWVGPESPFEAFVYEMEDMGGMPSFWLGGERVRCERWLNLAPNFTQASLATLESWLKSKPWGSSGASNPSADLESVGPWKNLSFSGIKHLVDRQIGWVPGFDGSALVSLLSPKGHEVSTANACHWGSPHINPCLLGLGLTAEEIQSSLIVSKKSLINPQFQKDLTEACKYLS